MIKTTIKLKIEKKFSAKISVICFERALEVLFWSPEATRSATSAVVNPMRVNFLEADVDDNLLGGNV
jgi:hypothetical protein